MECQDEPPPCNTLSDSDSNSEYHSESEPESGRKKPTSTIHTTPLSPIHNPVIPVLVMACNREDYLKTTLNNLFKYPHLH